MHVLRDYLGKTRSGLPKTSLESLMMILFRYRLIDVSIWRLRDIEFIDAGDSKVTLVPTHFVSKALPLYTFLVTLTRLLVLS